MRTFTYVAAQGELTLRRIGDVPVKRTYIGYVPLAPENGVYVLGHSETGHHHVVPVDGADVVVLEKPPEGMRILRMILENPTQLTHLREHDTHEAIALTPGEYEIRIAREFDHYAELARQSAD